MNIIDSKYHIWIILIFGLIVFGSHLHVLPVNIMEARNFITAREMVVDGNWLLTTMNELPRYEKPPLPTWLTAISGILFGIDNVGVLRLPAVLISIALLVGFYSLGHKALKLTKNQSFVATLVLSTSFYILFSGRNGQWDIFTHGFMIFGIYHFFQLFEKNLNFFRHAILGGIFLGLSFMSKGPVSLFALFLPFVIAYGIVFKFKSFRNKIVPFCVLLLIAIVLSAWWPYYIYLFDTSAAERIADKEATAWTNRNVRPFYYYWSFFTQSGLWTLPAFMGLLYPLVKKHISNLKVYRFSLAWTLISVVLLSCIPEKKSRYLLPVLIPLALTTSFYLEIVFNHFSKLTKWERIIPYIHFGIIALVAICFPFGVYFLIPETVKETMFWYVLASIFSLIIGVYLTFNLLKKNWLKSFYVTVIFVGILAAFALPLANGVKTNKQYKEIHFVKNLSETNNLKIYDLVNSAPELIWDFGGPIKTIFKDHYTINYPSEKQFGLLVMPTPTEDSLVSSGQKNYDEILATKAILESQFKDYDIKYITTYDHNVMGKKKGGYKKRLSRDFYILTKK